MKKILNAVGGRPNFMKVAPVHKALLENGGFRSMIVHTGQHYDREMSEVFFRQLELPEPDLYLGVGSGSHAWQTAKIMTSFEGVVLRERPDLVVVFGDMNSTLACSLVATKCHVKVAHVEAGLRSRDRRMPEEINRIVTDSLSDLLFVTEKSGLENLRAEGVELGKVHFVGNVMIDSLVRFREKTSKTRILEDLRLIPNRFILMTMHRPSNVDTEAGLRDLVRLLESVTALGRLVFPVHPRTLKRFGEFRLKDRVERMENLTLLEPLGYLDFLRLMENAALLITDSGGIQEETTFLRVPCLTLRETTERPVTIELGTNELFPLDAEQVGRRTAQILAGDRKKGEIPPRWDGRAAERIVEVLARAL